MLLSQNLCRRHQRALRACVNGDGGGQRGDYRFARAHVALQQAVHGHGLGDVVGDLLADALLGLGEVERNDFKEIAVQALGRQHSLSWRRW